MILSRFPRSIILSRSLTQTIHSSWISTFKKSLATKTNRSHLQDVDERSSVVAFNLGQSISINCLEIDQLKRFGRFKPLQLPADLQREAILLSDPETAPDRISDIFIFRKGTVVFWGLDIRDQRSILHELSSLTLEPNPEDLVQEEREYLEFQLVSNNEKTKLAKGVLQLELNKQNPSSRLIDQFATSHAIASSVELAIWETQLDKYLDSVNWITERMKTGTKIKLSRAQVFQKTGQLYQLKHKIISSDLLDLPDIYWDRHDQEILYMTLTSFLNIRKRTAVMSEKLNNCCELMNLLGAHMNDKFHVRLEWMIIILIMIEVIFEIFR